ncbi:MAG TPA: tetratricopeptide repeat protein [Sedimentisphaerales bacterium]|nr:tetratricopeptide repeat protein [Sedimentisphaerales bacterium]
MSERRHRPSILPRLIVGVVIASPPQAEKADAHLPPQADSNGGDCHGPKWPRNDAYSLDLARALSPVLVIAMVLTQVVFAESARTLTQRGNELYADGNFNEAINQYDQALTDMPGAPEPKLNKANSYYRLDDLSKAMDLYKEVAADAKEMDLVAKAKYNIGNCYFQQGSKQRDSDLQKALDDFKTSITYWRGVLDIEPENKKAAKNIEVARLTIKDILDQINKQKQDPNQPQDPNQSQQQQQQQNQQGQNQNQQDMGQDPNRSQDPNQAQKPNQGQDPNEPQDPNESDQQQQQNKQEKEQESVAADATAQEILDKEQQQKEQRQILQRGRYQKVERDW